MHRMRSSTNPNPNPNKTIMASGFLRALARINSTAPASSQLQRRRSIKRAAYASMARAAGHRRAWSRALLRSLHARSALRLTGSQRACVGRRIGVSTSRQSRTDVLRSLVPGGKGMDLCSLLEETAHYVQCLSMQVRLMQVVADSVSASDLK